MDILIGILLAVFGAAVGQVVARWDSWQQTASRGDLRGRWYSASSGADGEIVLDEISITKRAGKLYLKNSGNQSGYLYDCHCTVEAPNILKGVWRSLRPGSSLQGSLLLRISPQATRITGFYTGKREDGSDAHFGWVLAREQDDLPLACDALKANSLIPELPVSALARGPDHDF